MPPVTRTLAPMFLVAMLAPGANPALAWWWGSKDWGGPWTGAYNPWNAANNLPGPRFDSWSNPWTTGWGIPGFSGPYFSSGMYAPPYHSPQPTSCPQPWPYPPGHGPWLHGDPCAAPPPPPVAARPVR